MPYPARRQSARSGDQRSGAFTAEDLDMLTARAGLTPAQRLRIRAAAAVLGFRTTSYVTSELIDWSAVPGDPIYRLVFPAEELLPAAEVTRIADLLRGQAPRARCTGAIPSMPPSSRARRDFPAAAATDNRDPVHGSRPNGEFLNGVDQ